MHFILHLVIWANVIRRILILAALIFSHQLVVQWGSNHFQIFMIFNVISNTPQLKCCQNHFTKCPGNEVYQMWWNSLQLAKCWVTANKILSKFSSYKKATVEFHLILFLHDEWFESGHWLLASEHFWNHGTPEIYVCYCCTFLQDVIFQLFHLKFWVPNWFHICILLTNYNLVKKVDQSGPLI